MQRTKATDTKPEVLLRRALFGAGLRFRKNFTLKVVGLRTRGDIVFTRQQVAVFVDGCFWHGCPEHCRMPARNRTYWQAKIGRNRERDEQVTSALEEAGWHVVRIWEHEPLEDAVRRVHEALSGR